MMDLLLQMVAAPDNDQSRLDLAMVSGEMSTTCIVHTCYVQYMHDR